MRKNDEETLVQAAWRTQPVFTVMMAVIFFSLVLYVIVGVVGGT